MDKTNQTLGLDIGNSHIKAVLLDKSGTKHKLIKYLALPAKNTLTNINSNSNDKLKEARSFLASLIEEHALQSSDTKIVLPEHEIYSKIIVMPPMKGKEFKEAIQWEAEQHLPMPVTDVYLKYSIISEQGESQNKTSLLKKLSQDHGKPQGKGEIDQSSMEVMLVAAPKKTIDRYLKLFSKLPLELNSLEPGSITTTRSCLNTSSDLDVPTIVLNIGHTNTDIYFILGGSPRFVRSTKIGISAITKAISREVKISEIQATEYLYTYGLEPTGAGVKIRELASPIVDIILDELKKSIKFVENRTQHFSDVPDNRVKRVLLSGGGALIKGLILYIAEEVSVELLLANPWKTLDTGSIDGEELSDLGPLFPGAVGAALKDN